MKQTPYRKALAIIAVLRPQQWIKNAFVLAPLVFSRQYSDSAMCLKTLLALIGFCAVSSAVYLINDFCDRREDRNHPTKKHRPIASGEVSAAEAGILCAVLMALSVLVGIPLSWRYLLWVGLYAIINIAYSLGIKHMAILDVMTISAGFVLRILAGSAAIGVQSSPWLVLCTIMISIFLGFTKRRAELVAANEDQGQTRAVLKDYSIGFLDQVISMVTSVTIICYILYTIDDRTFVVFGSRAMLLTVPSVMYGIFRYLYIIYHLKQGEDPTAALVRDIPTIINLILWGLMSVLVVTYGTRLDIFG